MLDHALDSSTRCAFLARQTLVSVAAVHDMALGCKAGSTVGKLDVKQLA